MVSASCESADLNPLFSEGLSSLLLTRMNGLEEPPPLLIMFRFWYPNFSDNPLVCDVHGTVLRSTDRRTMQNDVSEPSPLLS